MVSFGGGGSYLNAGVKVAAHVVSASVGGGGGGGADDSERGRRGTAVVGVISGRSI